MSLSQALRRFRPRRLLVLAILACTPLFCSGCFTTLMVQDLTKGGRQEYWSDLHAPCAAYVGGDQSLTLVLPDRHDFTVPEARFFAVRFTPGEVAQATRVEMAHRRSPSAGLAAVGAGESAWRAPTDEMLVAPVREDLHDGVAAPLVFTPDRHADRISSLPGRTQTQWATALPPGGYWVKPSDQVSPYDGGGLNGRVSSSFSLGDLVSSTEYRANRWTPCIAESDGWAKYCCIRREGGTKMTALPTKFLWIPVVLPLTLAADAVTLPIQLPFVLSGGFTDIKG